MDESVEAILRPISPDFPIPVTTTRPLHPSRASTARSKEAPSRSCIPRTASASTRNTLFASSNDDMTINSNAQSALAQLKVHHQYSSPPLAAFALARHL